jgi:hypothetical protein
MLRFENLLAVQYDIGKKLFQTRIKDVKLGQDDSDLFIVLVIESLLIVEPGLTPKCRYMQLLHSDYLWNIWPCNQLR